MSAPLSWTTRPGPPPFAGHQGAHQRAPGPQGQHGQHQGVGPRGARRVRALHARRLRRRGRAHAHGRRRCEGNNARGALDAALGNGHAKIHPYQSNPSVSTHPFNH
eukprot:99098-Chlamydomonas_euryale.AAC.1